MKKILTFIAIAGTAFVMNAQNLKSIVYQDGTQKLNGLVTSNAGKKLPGVLILPAWKGIDNEAKTAALDLEKEGYVAFIADIYGEGNVPKDNAGAAKIATSYKTDYKAYQHRINLALNELKKQGVQVDKIAVIGYCFGGTGALETARAGFDVQGVVSIHGGYKKGDRPNGVLNTKILVEYPAEDKSISKEELEGLYQELKEGKGDWQVITYANSGHTFTNPESADYNKVMADRAWKHTLMFLKEILK